MIRLYDFPLSGHSHRVRLLLSLIGLEHEVISVNLKEGEQRGEEFTKINPFCKIPVLDDNGFVVRDSNAILVYLASKYAPELYPNDAESVARIQEWLSITTKELSEGPASARLVNVFGAKLDHEALIVKSHKLLSVFEKHLSNREWLALDKMSIVDISAYTYIAHAPEGAVSLEHYPLLREWIDRIEGLENFVAMPATITA
jgi:glutathione S-transferase